MLSSPDDVTELATELWSSWLIRIGVFGMLLIVIGAIRSTGPAAGLFGIYGAGLVLFGFGGHVLFSLYKTYTWRRHSATN